MRQYTSIVCYFKQLSAERTMKNTRGNIHVLLAYQIIIRHFFNQGERGQTKYKFQLCSLNKSQDYKVSPENNN